MEHFSPNEGAYGAQSVESCKPHPRISAPQKAASAAMPITPNVPIMPKTRRRKSSGSCTMPMPWDRRAATRSAPSACSSHGQAPPHSARISSNTAKGTNSAKFACALTARSSAALPPDPSGIRSARRWRITRKLSQRKISAKGRVQKAMIMGGALLVALAGSAFALRGPGKGGSAWIAPLCPSRFGKTSIPNPRPNRHRFPS